MPKLKNNLLSIGKLQANGLSILFQNETCKMFHPKRGLIMETKMSLNRMFVLHAISQPVAAVQTQLKLRGEVVQGLCRTLTAPIPIAIVGEVEGIQVLHPIIPLPIPGEAAVQVPSAANAERSLRERKKRRKGVMQLGGWKK